MLHELKDAVGRCVIIEGKDKVEANGYDLISDHTVSGLDLV
jgi:hypothetical protein